MTLKPIPGAPFGAPNPTFPGTSKPNPEPPASPESRALKNSNLVTKNSVLDANKKLDTTLPTGAVYWKNNYFGLWIVPNPIPNDDMDTLLQLHCSYHRIINTSSSAMFKGRGTSFTLLMNRINLTNALSKAKLFWSRWQPGTSMASSTGMFVVRGDPDYFYFIEVHTTGGIYAEAHDDRQGVKLTLRRDSIPGVSMETKRKADANTKTGFTLSKRELEQLCDKLGI